MAIRFIAILVATLMAIITMVFHIVYRSTILFAVGRVCLMWIGMIALIYMVNYFWRLTFASQGLPYERDYPVGNRIDALSRPQDDEFFR